MPRQSDPSKRRPPARGNKHTGRLGVKVISRGDFRAITLVCISDLQIEGPSWS